MYPCFPHSKDLSQMFVSARAMFDACWESSWCVLFSSVVAEISNLKRIKNFYGARSLGHKKAHPFTCSSQRHISVCAQPQAQMSGVAFTLFWFGQNLSPNAFRHGRLVSARSFQLQLLREVRAQARQTYEMHVPRAPGGTPLVTMNWKCWAWTLFCFRQAWDATVTIEVSTWTFLWFGHCKLWSPNTVRHGAWTFHGLRMDALVTEHTNCWDRKPRRKHTAQMPRPEI